MIPGRVILIATFVALALVLEVSVGETQIAQSYSSLTGTVIGVRARTWLDVQTEQDKAVVNFRVGKKTVYTPSHAYPYLLGKKVRVNYLVQNGVPVAHTVTLLEGNP